MEPPLGLRDAALEHVCRLHGADAGGMYQSFCDALEDALGWKLPLSGMQGFNDADEFCQVHWRSMGFDDMAGKKPSGAKRRSEWLEKRRDTKNGKRGSRHALITALKRRSPFALLPPEMPVGGTEDVTILEWMRTVRQLNDGTLEARKPDICKPGICKDEHIKKANDYDAIAGMCGIPKPYVGIAAALGPSKELRCWSRIRQSWRKYAHTFARSPAHAHAEVCTPTFVRRSAGSDGATATSVGCLGSVREARRQSRPIGLLCG